ncbi:MAG: phosphoribosylaminoimidazolesuccinocarboxamide synthase [Firmicutes bacterium]|nr:phosphoribosylaminoimidazolesuccinocarboxamide synthase [Bacillota bacterium]
MQKLICGKTKDVYLQPDGHLLLVFKDTVTGTAGKIDPGANEVIGELAGKGQGSSSLSIHFFKLLTEKGLPTHFIKPGPEPNTMVVKKARSFELEVICRKQARGSFVRRYGKWVTAGTPLPSLVEFTLKDDKRGDPFINEDTLVALGILAADTILALKKIAQQATSILKADLAARGLELLDIKYEFGEVDGRTVIIDEISGDTMRVMQHGRILQPDELCSAYYNSPCRQR